MRSVEEDIRSLYPGILVYSIRIDDDQGKDRKAGFFGNVNAQIELVAEQLGKIDDLVDGFDAIGFSQGGQFLRCDSMMSLFPLRRKKIHSCSVLLSSGHIELILRLSTIPPYTTSSLLDLSTWV